MSGETRASGHHASAILLATLVAASASAWGGEARTDRRLSMETCIRIALEENLEIRSQRLQTQKVKFDVSSARAAFLPTVSASATYDDDNPETTSGSVSITQNTPWGTSLTLSGSRTTGSAGETTTTATLTQPLIRELGPSAANATLNRNRLALAAAEARLERRIQDTVYEIRTKYYDVARILATVRVRRQAVARARRLLDEAAFKRERGMVTVLDHANAVIQLADRQASLVSTEKQLEDALDDLKEALNLPIEEQMAIVPIVLDIEGEVVVDDTAGTVSVPETREDGEQTPAILKTIFAPVPREYDTIIEMTMASRPDLSAALLDLESRRIELARKRNLKRHELDASITYGASGSPDDDLIGLPADEWSATVTYSLPIGRVARKGDHQKALLDVEVQEIAVERLRISIRKEMRRLFRGLRETEANILTYARKIGAAGQALESAKIRKERGQTSYWEVTARESDLLDAQTSFINSYLDYQKRLAELDHACGCAVEIPSGEAAANAPVE